MNPTDNSLFDFTAPSTAVIQGTAMGDPGDVQQNVIVQDGQTIPVALAGGRIIGKPTWAPTVVSLAQLRLDPRSTIRPNYGTNADHQKDDEFLALRESIRQTGINVEPILVETTTETVVIDGEVQPVLRVRAGGRRYWVLVDLGFSEALVRVLPDEVAEQDRLMLGLLQNEMREPLAILDRCDVIHTLCKVHGVRQHVVAKKTGYSQSYVSRLCQAAEQTPRIRTYLSNHSLTLEQVALLAERIDNDDERDTAAWWCVQEALSAAQTKEMLNECHPPAELGEPVAALLPPSVPGGLVQKRNLSNNLLTSGSNQSNGPKPYWKRGAPLAASPKRILQHHHSVMVSGTSKHPVVHVDTLESRTFFRQLERQKATTVDLVQLEEAMLSDLEAIRQAIISAALPDYESEDTD